MGARKKAKRLAFAGFSVFFGNSEQENILQTITHLIQYTNQSWPVKHKTINVRCAQISTNMSFFPIQVTQSTKRLCNVMVRLDERKPLQNAFKRI